MEAGVVVGLELLRRGGELGEVGSSAESPVELCLGATESGHAEEDSQAEDQRVLDIAHDDFLILIQ